MQRLVREGPWLGLWLVVLMIAVLAQGCATSYKPKVTGPLPFAFTPTEEQCAQLLKERRTYRATEKTATYVSTAGALLSVLFLGLVDEKAAPAASAGATLLASGVSVFAGSQVQSLEEEIDLGSCLNRPPPPLPTLAPDTVDSVDRASAQVAGSSPARPSGR